MSDNYANGAHIPDGDGYADRWQQKAADFRRRMPPLTVGDADLFLPPAPKGLVVFIHGGFWMATGRDWWSHLAAGAVGQGWAVAMPSYTLAPAARIGAMADQMCQAVVALRGVVAGPCVVTGHSAGGHLAAMVATRVAVDRCVPISPLGDLRPFLEHPMNATLGLDAEEALAQSPVTHRPLCPVHVHVGGQERAAFLWQARLLSEVWDCPWAVAAGRHHFDVIEDLERPSALLDVLLQG